MEWHTPGCVTGHRCDAASLISAGCIAPVLLARPCEAWAHLSLREVSSSALAAIRWSLTLCFSSAYSLARSLATAASVICCTSQRHPPSVHSRSPCPCRAKNQSALDEAQQIQASGLQPESYNTLACAAITSLVSGIWFLPCGMWNMHMSSTRLGED